LGRDGTGIAVPIEVEVLPEKTSLDFLHVDKEAAKRKKAAEGLCSHSPRFTLTVCCVSAGEALPWA
jgi:hypothetical protein